MILYQRGILPIYYILKENKNGSKAGFVDSRCTEPRWSSGIPHYSIEFVRQLPVREPEIYCST